MTPDTLDNRKRVGVLGRITVATFVFLCLLVAVFASVCFGFFGMIVAVVAITFFDESHKQELFDSILLPTGFCFWLVGFVLPIAILLTKRTKYFDRRIIHLTTKDSDEAAECSNQDISEISTHLEQSAGAPRGGAAPNRESPFIPGKLAQEAQLKARIFISYSRKDMAFADRLEAALKARSFAVLIDRQEIYVFEDWWKRIEALIGGADTVVFVLSPDSVRSDVALKEVTLAASLNKRFAPIVCRRVADSAVPEVLRRLNFIFFDDPTQFEVSAEKLAEGLQTDIGWIRRHTEFGEAARRWIEGGRASGLLLRPPVLDQAEAWMAFQPSGVPSPTGETKSFVAASRKAEVAARRRSRILKAALYTMLIGIILGLVGWKNQPYIVEQWRDYTVTRPYMLSEVRPYVLTAAKEQALKAGDSFKECARDCPEMIVVPAGSFTMGGAKPAESPRHRVTIAKPFAVSKYELTFADWDACVTGGGCNGYKPNDQGWGRGQQP